MESHESFASAKHTAIESGRKIILVVDSSKFNQKSYFQAGDLKDIDVVITDRKPDEEWLAHFEDLGIECRYPD